MPKFDYEDMPQDARAMIELLPWTRGGQRAADAIHDHWVDQSRYAKTQRDLEYVNGMITFWAWVLLHTPRDVDHRFRTEYTGTGRMTLEEFMETGGAKVRRKG